MPHAAGLTVACSPLLLVSSSLSPCVARSQNFSSVVGPNGSGKSNVIDSLLFVLGRRANQIRLKKLSELIHKSADHPNLKECRVDIHFADIIDDNSPDGFTVVPNSEFVVSRAATHESQSSYRINGRSATGADVQTLLKGKGMDLDNNRFLILQGEVELISLMKPKAAAPHETGILEYLEDLIGTNQYVQPIEALQTKVEELNEGRQEKLQRLKIVEKEKDALEGPKLEAEEYQSKAHSLAIQKVQLAQIQRAEAAKQTADFDAQQAALDAEKAALTARIQTCQQDVTRLESSHSSTVRSHEDVTAAVSKSKVDYGSFERKYAKLQEQTKHKKKLREKHVTKATQSRAKAVELAERMESDAVQLPKAIKKSEKLASEKSAAEAIVAEQERALMAISEPFKLEIESLQKSLIPLQAETNACQQAVDCSNNEINIYKDKLRTSETKYNEVKALLAKNATEMQRLNGESKTIASQLSAAQQKSRELDEELAAVVASESNGLKKRSTLLASLEDSKASQSSASSHGRVLQALLAAKKKKLLPGIFGRLGDLGTIDAKYDVAITTGVGALSMVLCDTSATGTKAIAYLKSNNIGRSTFLALDKQNFSPDKLKKMTDTPENVPRLFDLIELKEARFAPAFYFACRDTLVARDMDQATRIAFGDKASGKRWRVITLDGKVIDTAGTMSGGGAEVRRGGMASKSASSSARETDSTDSGEPLVDIKAAEAELAQLESNLVAIRRAKKDLEGEIASIAQQIAELETAQSKNASTLRELKAANAEYQTRCATLEQSLSLSPDELAQLKSIESSQASQLAALSTAKKAAKAVSEKVDKLQAKIMERGGGALESQKAKVNQIGVEYAVLQEEVNRMQVLAETGEKKRAKLEADAEESETEAAQIEAELTQLDSEVETLLDKAESVKRKLSEAEACLAEATATLAGIEKELGVSKAALRDLNSEKVDLDEKEKDFNKAAKEVRARTNMYDKKIATLVRGINRDILMARKEIEVDAVVEEAPAPAPADGQEEEKVDASSKRHDRSAKRAAAVAAAAVEEDDDAGADGSFDGAYQLLTPEEVAALDRRAIERQITLLEETLASLKPNMSAIVAFLRKEREYNQRVALLDAVTAERDAARKSHEELRRRRLDEFMAGFGVITMKLKEMYQMLTLGGDAELELVDSLDPFSEGIVFSVRPPKKSWKNITNLSGGEKTLSSLALVFALHHYKPTPLYVMDEIDAALDFKNVSIVANYIKERTKNAQFIIISLRNNMFELADRLVGIYKTNNVTRSITIDPKLFIEPAQAEANKRAAETKEQESA